MEHKIYGMPFASVYPLYIQKVQRKGKTKEDVDEVTRWLTGFTQEQIDAHVAAGTSFRDFFAEAEIHPHATLITGVICGVRVQEIEDPLMRTIRYLDKLVDEVAQGKAMAKILRTPAG